MTFSKADQVSLMARAGGTSRKASAAMLDALVKGIVTALASGIPVDLNRFGRFTCYERRPRKGRDLHSGKELTIPASRTARFALSPALKAKLNESSAGTRESQAEDAPAEPAKLTLKRPGPKERPQRKALALPKKEREQ